MTNKERRELMNASRRMAEVFTKMLKNHPFKSIDLRKPMLTHADPCQVTPVLDESGQIASYAINPPVRKHPDVMIDIEAYADTPDSAPAQIALVFFDRDDPSLPFTEFLYHPTPISSMRLGMKVTADTLVWWDDKGLGIHPQTGQPITEILSEIHKVMDTYAKHGIRAWSRGNSYDLSIMKLLYQRTCMRLPWQFWMERDVRTWLEGCRYTSPRKNDHHALRDARNQALDIIEATASLK